MEKKPYETCDPEHKIIVMTATYPGYYGFGPDIKTAKRNCLKESGHTASYYKGKLVGYVAHKETVVTGLGDWQVPKDTFFPYRIGLV